MLFLNYNGLTYRWNYNLDVEVLDGSIAVDHFTLGYSHLGPPTVSDFLRGVHAWNEYLDGWRESQDTEDNLSDVEADAMTLASAGWGTDEDYGYAGDEY
jgi:hypothetical protein